MNSFKSDAKFASTTYASDESVDYENFTVDCSTNLDDGIPIPSFIVDSNLTEESNFNLFKKDCQFERIWSVRDDSDQSKLIVQILNLNAEMEIFNFNQTMIVDCDGKTEAEIVEIISEITPTAKATCFEEYVNVTLTVKDDDDFAHFVCPGIWRIENHFCFEHFT